MSDPEKKRLGDYEILNVLGSGGMGRVFRVRNTITDRVEAMKVLLPDLQGHEEVAARFVREIKVLAALNHPNIAALHTALTIDNQLVMIMEYVEGQSLSARLNSGPIPVLEALAYLDQVLDALSYAHHQHVIHRDIKPANMMLTPQGTVKLMDFGIARSQGESNKLTATGSTLGSLNYMSPEQVKGESADERSDLYSLGISLYEMVTGKKPFDADSGFSIMAAQVNQAPKPPIELNPNVPGIVNDIILTAIAKSPGQRYQTADAFRQAVQRARLSIYETKTAAGPSLAAAATASEERTMLQGSRDSSFASTPVPPAHRTSAATAVAPALSTNASASPAASAAATPAAVSPRSAAVAAQSAPPPHVSSGHRGLYMALGAAVVVIILIVAGIYLPRSKSAAAGASDSSQHVQQAPSSQVTQAPGETNQSSSSSAQTSAASPAQAAADQQKQAAEARQSALREKKLAATEAALRAAQEQEAAAKAATAAELAEAERSVDQLTGRAAAVNSSLDTLQRQQNAAGYGLRGDIASKQATMNLNLARAQNAISHGDAANAKRYADMASSDADALERFLGR